MERPHDTGSQNGKHIPIRCPIGASSDFLNYKGFYFLVLLIDDEYKFIWYNIAVAESSCDTQIFNLFIWGFTSLSTLYRSYHDGAQIFKYSDIRLDFHQVLLPFV